MAHATRFDLSRLEGCTGTLTQRPDGAVDEPLRPASAAGTPDERPTPVDARGTANPATDAGEPSSNGAPPRRVEDPGSPAGKAPATARAAAPERRSATGPLAASSGPAADDEGPDTLPLTTIVALTLAAWLPVLWLMRDWMGR